MAPGGAHFPRPFKEPRRLSSRGVGETQRGASIYDINIWEVKGVTKNYKLNKPQELICETRGIMWLSYVPVPKDGEKTETATEGGKEGGR